MIRQVLFLIAAGAVMMGASVVAWQNWQGTRTATDLAERYVKELGQAEQREREARDRMVAMEAPRVEAISVAMKMAAAGSASAAARGSMAPAPASLREQISATGDRTVQVTEITQGDPTVRNAEMEAHLSDVKWMSKALFRRLGLSPEAQERFLHNLGRRVSEHEAMLAAARTLGVDYYDPILARLNAESEASYLTAQRELLGEAGVREMLASDRSGHARNIANGFAGMATLVNQPLTAGQVEQLARIIEEATSEPYSRVFPRMVDMDWATIDARVDELLTPAQAELFRSAEAPGLGRGGTRFGLKLNQVLGAANLADRARRQATKAGK